MTGDAPPRDPAKPREESAGRSSTAPAAPPILLGDVRVDIVSDGTFRLDGGSMFGVVPRVIWEKLAPPDARHRIPLGLNCLLVRTPTHTVLVDTGMGDKWDAKFVDVYDLAPPRGRLVDGLAALGVAPADVDVVVYTHLHLDHTGAGTRRTADGLVVPTFPRARHVVQEGEWFAATRPDPRSRPSYREDHFLPLREAGVLDLLDGEREVVPGIRVRLTPGHTAYHQSVIVGGGGRTLCYLGDIIPTTAHLSPTYAMGFDLFPLEVVRQRTVLLEEASEEGWIVVWEHDPLVAAGRVAWDGRRGSVLPMTDAGEP